MRMTLGGVNVDLCEKTDVRALVASAVQSPVGPALAIASANLDHIHAFADGRADTCDVLRDCADVTWLVLVDGVPLLASARRTTGHRWPRLAGADLLLPILFDAAEAGVVVGFLGGTSEMHEYLAVRLELELPSLKVGGYWAPTRATVEDQEQSEALADEVAVANVEILVVGLGKPRQEQWIQQHAARTRARVLLAFGAAPDFLAGVGHRAPEQLREHGLEWAYRLAREPRRLARRYLIQGPPAALRLIRAPKTHIHDNPHLSPRQVRSVAVVVVTYNNERDIAQVLDSIPAAAAGLAVMTIVVDNGSTDATASVAARPDVTLIETGQNLGYAGGINVARSVTPDAMDAIAILNPDLVLAPESLTRLAQGLSNRDVGVCVPKVLNPDGSVFRSLRLEPTVLGALGEAAFGSHWARRPAVLGDTVRIDADYEHEQTVDWASGACWMVATDCDREVGAWDDSFFLYSEETDYARRVRNSGFTIDYEPTAVVEHVGGGSGRSADLSALMAVNRVRDYERHHGRTASLLFRIAVASQHATRSARSEDRRALAALLRRSSWSKLPGAQTRQPDATPS